MAVRAATASALLISMLLLAAAPGGVANIKEITSWTTGTSGPSRGTSGTDRLLIFTARVEANSDVTIDSVTYGGRPMAEVAGTGVFARSYVSYYAG